MPLSIGLRNEENERINNILNRLLELAHVPGNFDAADADVLLSRLGMSTQSILDMSADDLNQHLLRMHFDYANMEKLADALAILPLNRQDYKQKAIAVYEFIQRDSKMLSFEIVNKIELLK